MRWNKKGFTLVEIIVVLLILAILAAIAIPSMLGYVEEARKSEYYAYGRNINEEVNGYFIKQETLNQEKSFDELVNSMRKDLSWTADSKLKDLITSDIPEGFTLHSVDLSFDNKYSDKGWDYDKTKTTHKITKVSIYLAKYNSKGIVEDAVFIVTLLNKNSYIYDKNDFNAAVGKEEGPVIPR